MSLMPPPTGHETKRVATVERKKVQEGQIFLPKSFFSGRCTPILVLQRYHAKSPGMLNKREKVND